MSALWKQLGVVTAGMFLAVAFQAHASGTDMETTAGGELFTKTCAACHTAKPAKLMGKPVAELVKDVNKYQAMTNPTGGAAKMHNAVKDLKAKQIEEVAIYLNMLK